MKQPEYGRIRWVDSYIDSSSSAEFIIRKMNYCIRLERYKNDRSHTLHEFPLNALEQDAYRNTLLECRHMIGSKKIIWVEKPIWKYL